MILFGQKTNDMPAVEQLLEMGKHQTNSLQKTRLADILRVLDGFGQQWKPGSALFEEALIGLRDQLPFSEEMVRLTLAIIPELLSRNALEQRLRGEFDNPQSLDEFVSAKNGLGKVRAFPVGQLLHVTAGNVFISCIDSLVMGFITKNVSYVKLSSSNNFFPFFFAEALIKFDQEKVLADKFCMLIWKGGDARIEAPFKKQIPAILAWGGEEMLQNYRLGLGPSTKLLDYGPKISFQLITQAGVEKLGLAETGAAIAQDLIMWDQQACSSPQNLFFEKGIDVPALMSAIGSALDVITLARGPLSADEQVEILKERERARVSRLLENGHSLEGKDWLLHQENRPFLRTSPLNRTLILKPFTTLNDLETQVAPFRFYLQSCGYLTGVDEKHKVLELLGAMGLKRLTSVGQMSSSFPGLPHDGRYGLTELVSFVTDEVACDLDRFITHLKTNIPYYQGVKHQRLEDFALTDGTFFSSHDPAIDPALVARNAVGGRYFASGGTTGKPKHIFYSNADFDRLSALFAEHFLRSGIKPGTKVANLFASGALYSSFLAVDKYCEKIGLKQLPIGGLLAADEIVNLLQYHRPEAVFGLPSLLIQYARAAEARGIKLEIPMVFFAGENLSLGAQAYLREQWGTEKFWSAGYATVDAGMIGYQCDKAAYGVHHLCEPHVILEVIDGEAVVTSMIREGMPVVRYRTGDRVDLIEGACACGDQSRRFRLLGRMDSQINIWACRLPLSDLEHAMTLIAGDLPDYQVQVESVGADERLTLICKTALPEFHERLRAVSLDVQHTVSLDFLKRHLLVEAQAAMKQNSRTGKIPRLVDLR